MSGITIREATTADGAMIGRVQVESWRTTYRGMVSDEYMANLSYEERKDRWERAAGPEGLGFVYVAEDAEGEIVGFAAGGKSRSNVEGYEGELYAIYLLEEEQGKGTGRALTQAVAQRLSQMGIVSMLVWVVSDNHPARRFYEKLGGKRLFEQEFELDGMTLRETGYGWENIEELL